ncbi:MAG: hypothetical protein QXS21_01545 [Thermoproteota archaeon]|nr:hypothetical protein [Candidatus Brockarchaeota archaeon]MBO3767972.1 hypothetical protein [Candidatus Brockarchaeota archaeon]MBO3802132.1 hypothetical protein [Candidatus Brockarchaeota archaeon]
MLRKEANYILASQTKTGSIKLTPTSQDIIPYFSNIAAVGLLKAYKLTGNSTYLIAAKNWLDWYSIHQNKGIDIKGISGTIYDFKLLSNGSEAPTFDYDSSDSYAATYLWAIYEYFLVTNDTSYLKQRKENIQLALNAIFSTMDKDNLTYAKPDYKVKYLMDNCEVYRGVYSAGKILLALGSSSYGIELIKKSESIRNSILSTFLAKEGYFIWAPSVNVNLNNFYPDLMANFWPIVMGVVDGNSSTAQRIFDLLSANKYWDVSVSKSSAAMSSAYFSYLVGRSNITQVLFAKASALYPGNEWPWNVAEAAWTILAFYRFNVSGYLVVNNSRIDENQNKLSLNLTFGGCGNGTLKIFVPVNCKNFSITFNNLSLNSGTIKTSLVGLDKYLQVSNVNTGDKIVILFFLNSSSSSSLQSQESNLFTPEVFFAVVISLVLFFVVLFISKHRSS